MMRGLLISLLTTLSANVAAQSSDLYDIYFLALESDPRIRIAQQQVEIGKAQKDEAFGSLLPQANFSASYSDNEVDYENDILPGQNYDGERLSLQVRQALFNWQAISANAGAREVVAQREAELLEAMGVLLVDVSERYFRVLLADGDLTLSKAEEELVSQQLRESEELFERKLVRVTDFLETQARYDRVRTGLIEAENEAALAREALAELTGEFINELVPLRDDFTLPGLEHSAEYWTEKAMSSNAQIASRQQAVLAAERQIEQEKGGHYPTLDLVLSGQRSDVGFDNQVSPQRDTQYIGLDLQVPIYSGGKTSARVREAWSRYYIAREEEEAARRQVRKATREAWLNTRSSRKRIDSAALSVKSATKSYEAMSKSFSYGTVRASDVLEALRGQTRALRDYQDAIYTYLVNWLALKRQAGTLGAEDLKQLNEWLMATADDG